ncbi:MAG: hypothetical protein ACJAVK_001690, partial [Akkermansiaceae bacterium]
MKKTFKKSSAAPNETRPNKRYSETKKNDFQKETSLWIIAPKAPLHRIKISKIALLPPLDFLRYFRLTTQTI